MTGTRWSGLSWDLRMKSRGLLGEGPPVHRPVVRIRGLG